VPALPARSRARLLARHGRISPALVCPLVLAQAAEIEALPVPRFVTDATKLANGLRALRGAFGNDVIVTAAADDLAAAAAGDLAAARAGSPAADPRVAAAVEATRRLAVTAEDAALAVALCGPAGLAAQLGQSAGRHATLETCGAVLPGRRGFPGGGRTCCGGPRPLATHAAALAATAGQRRPLPSGRGARCGRPGGRTAIAARRGGMPAATQRGAPVRGSR
jgi:hypothetical protein